jgi:catechol 2,3-dioxygenase-like lactoylglutathione lyase family enzyme
MKQLLLITLLAAGLAPALAQGTPAGTPQAPAPQVQPPPAAPAAPPLIPLGDSRPYSVAISVSSVDRSAGWYMEIFGFKPVLGPLSPASGAAVAVLERGDFSIELVSLIGSRQRAAATPEPNNPVSLRGVFKFGVLVKDLDQAFAALKLRNVPVVLAPVDDATLPIRYCVIQDPDGNMIQVFQRLDKP